MNKAKYIIPFLVICLLLSGCVKTAAADPTFDYGRIKSDFSGMTPEIAGAYLAVVDGLSAQLGYDEAEASEGECLHGGFVRDWDGDGTPELCLLLKTSPREPEGPDGTPLYGWYPPTLWLYTVLDGQAVRVGAWDLYFATGGREAAVAALTGEDGMRYLRWDRSLFAEGSELYCYELADGAVRETAAPADALAAAAGAETARAFLDALGADRAHLLLYNNSGEAGIEGQANARDLRAALAAKTS